MNQQAGNEYPDLNWLFAIPNGAWTKNIQTAIKLKREGLKSGVPDLFLPVPIQKIDRFYPGLFIEMKSEKGKTSDNQDDWIAYLLHKGYKVAICKSWPEAARALLSYLNAPERDIRRLVDGYL